MTDNNWSVWSSSSSFPGSTCGLGCGPKKTSILQFLPILDLDTDKLELLDFAILSTTLGGDWHLQYACVVAEIGNSIECTSTIIPKVSFTDQAYLWVNSGQELGEL